MPNEGDLSSGAKVARGATYVFIQGLASAALGVVYIVFLTRLLSQEEIGTFGVLTFVLGLIQTAGLLALPSASISARAKLRLGVALFERFVPNKTTKGETVEKT